MARFLHSTLQQTRTVGADVIERIDLGVNPLSMVLLTIKPLNDTGTLSNFARYLAICESLNNILITHQGASVFNMSGSDAAALAYFRHGMIWPQANSGDTNNDRRAVVLPIFMGRFAYDLESCFPASRRGEFILELDIDVADTGYDGYTYSVDIIELLGIKPKHFERKTTLTATWGATGRNDLDLPIGNVNRGFLLFGSTGFAGAAPVPSWDDVELQLDNQQVGYTALPFEVAHGLSSLMGRMPPSSDNHFHRVDTTTSVATQPSGGPVDLGSIGWENYAFLDLDPTRDDMFSVDTKSAASWRIRSNAGTANLVRAISIERIAI